ncbi:pseudouridylate synthase 10 [Mucor ambiguus]|uniref:tRNA pseudouridine(55) synthase n=1 Tax=Mucor ambiguus TaxID=91626 RepID=A0A0C9MGP3_9FUNG|nr:pseudouridylate synthase 10 [Mucor ambiguus]
MSSVVEQVHQCLLESRLNKDPHVSVKGGLTIVEILVAAKCCFRCCLRFVGCTNFRLYAFDENELHDAFNQLLYQDRQLNYNVDENAVCSACLGSIQYADSYVDNVCEQLKKEDYKTNSCCLTCTLPVSILLRDHLLKVHVMNTLVELYADQEYTSDLVRLYKDVNVRDPKDFFKYLFGMKLKEKTGFHLDADGALLMTVVISHEPTAKDHLFLAELKEPLLKMRTVRQKKIRVTVGDSRPCIIEALTKLDNEEAKSFTAIPPAQPTERAKFDSVALLHTSSHVGGRYLKYSREYSQTPWAIKGRKLAEHSVSDCFAEIIRKYHRADDTKFVTAGREDANVRMLGTGRPFYLELINPRTPRLSDEQYKQIEQEINNQPIHKDNVQVRHLGYIKPEYTSIIKEGEETKTKRYRALVWLSEPLTDQVIERINKVGSVPFTIQQKTPVRVFQRRSAAIRPKVIHTSTIARLHPDVDLDSPEARYGVLKLHTQAGTYIKEYVHGDLGRTLPNLASVGGIHSADLLELDVMDVDLVWPPQFGAIANNEETSTDVSNENNKRPLLNVQ